MSKRVYRFVPSSLIGRDCGPALNSGQGLGKNVSVFRFTGKEFGYVEVCLWPIVC